MQPDGKKTGIICENLIMSILAGSRYMNPAVLQPCVLFCKPWADCTVVTEEIKIEPFIGFWYNSKERSPHFLVSL